MIETHHNPNADENQGLSAISFLLSLFAFVVGTAITPMEYNIILNRDLVSVWQLILGWYVAGFGTLYLVYSTGSTFSSVVGSVLALALGPISFMSHCLVLIFRMVGLWR